MIRAYDVDGVLADFNTRFRELIHELTDVRLPPISDSYPNVWHYHKVAGVTSAENTKLWNYIKKEQNEFLLTLDPMPGCNEALAFIEDQRQNGDQIYFVTSRAGDFAQLHTQFWLEDQGFDNASVLLADSKGLLLKALNVDFFVDDKPENCVDALSWGIREVFLVDQPYNRDFYVPGRQAIRVPTCLAAINFKESRRYAA